MKDLVLHIGWPKTGTSSLQGLMASNADVLYEAGVLYPTIERWADAHHCACGLFIEHDDPLIPPPLGTLDSFIAHLTSRDFSKANTIFISSEGFCRATALKREAFAALAGVFNVKVIAAVREPFFWANSLLNEFAKGRLFHDAVFDGNAVASEMILRDFFYPSRLQVWADVIGRENVQVVSVNEGDDTVGAILATVGVERTALKTRAPAGTNASFSLGALQLISWLCRSRYNLDHSMKVAIDRRLRELPHQNVPNLLPPRLEKLIIEQTPGICDSLSRDWLGGRTPFANSPKHTMPASADVLSCPDVMRIAEHALADRKDILRDLARTLEDAC